MSRTQGHTYSSVEPRMRVLMDDEMMREILTDVGAMRSALELELWASWILGQTWKQRARQPQFADVDWMLTLGAPMVTMIADVGGPRARKALSAISMLERGALGNYAGAVALTLSGARTPAWMKEMSCARFSRARHAVSAGEGEAVVLDLCRADRPEVTVALFIDEALGGAVKWIELVGPCREGDEDGFSGLMKPADLDEVSIRVRRAIGLTDLDPSLPVAHGVADLRAFVLARLPAAQSGVV